MLNALTPGVHAAYAFEVIITSRSLFTWEGVPRAVESLPPAVVPEPAAGGDSTPDAGAGGHSGYESSVHPVVKQGA